MPGLEAKLARALIEPPQAPIAGLAACGIAACLTLRYGVSIGPRWELLPLYPVLVLGAVPLTLSVAWKAAHKQAGADLVAAISIAASLAMGQLLVAAILVLMLSGGGALERLVSRRAAGVLDALAKRMPQRAHIKLGGSIREAGLKDVFVGDFVVVYPHEICPVDGIVREGRGWMDESYLTGEPFQLPKSPGSTALSGAVNGDAVLVVEARKLAGNSRYVAIMRVMEESVQSRPRLRRLGDELAAWYVPATMGFAALAWLASGDSLRSLAVLVAATPCPLIIAIPVAIIAAVSLAAKRSIIIRDPTVLEQISRCRTAVFDKTGTLTYGRPLLTEVLCGEGFIRTEVLSLAAGLERYSRHPLAGAVLKASADEAVEHFEASEIAEKPGSGLEGKVGGRLVRITGRTQAQAAGNVLPASSGGLECAVLIDGMSAALFRFRDAPRAESRSFVAHLPRLHGFSKLMLVSGDRESEVRYLADAVGISEVHAGCSPERKVSIVAAETKRAPTLFVGDGINDAPALLQATVGVAIGDSSDVAGVAAGAVILTPELGKVDELIHIGRRMRAIALQSALGGMALSLVAMAAAATGHLSPVAGAVAQELIDLAAILNAARAARPGRLTDF